MDLNNPVVTPDARHIVGRLLLNGIEVPFVSADVDSNAFYSADTFSVVFALSAMPTGMDLLSWWSNQTSIEVSIAVGIRSPKTTDWETLIVGGVDRWTFQPARFEVRVEGRDYTAKLIDAKTSESFKNLTTSQLATLLAQRHGLTPVVTATQTTVGSIYKYDHAHVTDERSEWDLLSYFAGVDGFQTYVKGNELHYEPDPSSQQPAKQDLSQLEANLKAIDTRIRAKMDRVAQYQNAANSALQINDNATAAQFNSKGNAIISDVETNDMPVHLQAKAALEAAKNNNKTLAGQYVIRWVPRGALSSPQANCTDDLTFERDLTLAKGVTVQVRSWTKGKAYTVSYPTSTAKGIAPGQSTAKRQVYSVVRNGLDKAAAMQLAQKLHKQITDHEMRMNCSLPGDNLLMPNVMVRVEGTNSTFDQLYYVDSVRRSISFESGYSMSLTAKNHNPNSMILP